MAGRPQGSVNKRTSRASELFAPYVQGAIDSLHEIQERGKKAKESGDVVELLEMRAKDSDVIAASKIILEYGLGKPVQPVEQQGEDGGPIKVQVEMVKPGNDTSL